MQPQLCPIVPGPRPRGLKLRRGLTYLIHSLQQSGGTMWQIMNKLRAKACGILPFVSLHHMSWRLGEEDRGGGHRSSREASPVLETLSLLGTLPRLYSLSLDTREKKIILTLLFQDLDIPSILSLLKITKHPANFLHCLFSQEPRKKHQRCE